MGTLELEQYEERPVIPDGEIFLAEVLKAQVRDTPFDDDKNPGQKQKEVSFTFKIVAEGEWHAQIVYGRTPTTFSTHPDCKLRLWVQEVLGGNELPAHFKLRVDDNTGELEDLVGLPVRVAIGVRERTGKDGNTIRRNFVSDVIHATEAKLASDMF